MIQRRRTSPDVPKTARAKQASQRKAPPLEEKTEYLDTLDPASKRRHLDKIKLKNNIDPYKIDKKDWSKEKIIYRQ